MLSAFIGGFGELAKRPFYFVPALLAIVINLAILLLVVDVQFDFFYSVFVLGEVPETTLIGLPFYVATGYWQQLLIIGAAAMVSFMLSFYQLYVYSALIGKKKPVIGTSIEAFSKIPEIFGLAFFAAIASFIYFTIAYFIFIATVTFGGIGIVFLLLLLAWIIAGVYASLKLLFTPLFMAIEKKKLKQSLSESWKWSSGKVVSIVALILLLGLVAGAISGFFSVRSDEH